MIKQNHALYLCQRAQLQTYRHHFFHILMTRIFENIPVNDETAFSRATLINCYVDEANNCRRIFTLTPQPGTDILIQADSQVLIYFYRLAKPGRLLPRSSEPCSPAQPRARSSTQSKLQPGQLHRLPDPQRLSSRTWLYRLLHRSKHSEDRVPLVQPSRSTSTCTSTSTSTRKLGCHRFHNLSKSPQKF